MVDTHCHLQDPRFDVDRETVIEAALEVLEWLVVVGDTIDSSRAAVHLTRPRVYATVGIHPHHADEWNADASAALLELRGHLGVVALGEIGLDYYYDHASRPVQRATFEAQLALAEKLRLPVVVHCREAQQDAIDILESFQDRLPAVVMHCFSGGPEWADRCVSRGFYVSFAGNLTFPKAEELRESVPIVPFDRLLVETDCPYLAPQPVRGKRCEPGHVRYTAETVAQLKRVSLEEFSCQTSDNARRVFNVAPDLDR